jgi:hypothetical protein
MTRVIPYRVGVKPQVISVSPDADGSHLAALQQTLAGPVSCVPLHGEIQLCCNRGGLLFGLALARRALGRWRQPRRRARPWSSLRHRARAPGHPLAGDGGASPRRAGWTARTCSRRASDWTPPGIARIYRRSRAGGVTAGTRCYGG